MAFVYFYAKPIFFLHKTKEYYVCQRLFLYFFNINYLAVNNLKVALLRRGIINRVILIKPIKHFEKNFS